MATLEGAPDVARARPFGPTKQLQIHNQSVIMNSGTEIFLRLRMFKTFLPNAWQMINFRNPLAALILKNPFSFFLARFRVQVTCGARGSIKDVLRAVK